MVDFIFKSITEDMGRTFMVWSLDVFNYKTENVKMKFPESQG